jgi:hypothetical protein
VGFYSGSNKKRILISKTLLAGNIETNNFKDLIYEFDAYIKKQYDFK